MNQFEVRDLLRGLGDRGTEWFASLFKNGPRDFPLDDFALIAQEVLGELRGQTQEFLIFDEVSGSKVIKVLINGA